MEFQENVDQHDLSPKEAQRYQQVLAYYRSQTGPRLKPGSLVKSWRIRNGRKSGPYYRLAFRHAGQQRSIYLGRSERLAQKLRNFLRPQRELAQKRRQLAQLKAQVALLIQEDLKQVQKELAPIGLYLKGWEVRGFQDQEENIRRYQIAKMLGFAPPKHTGQLPKHLRDVPLGYLLEAEAGNADAQARIAALIPTSRVGYPPPEAFSEEECDESDAWDDEPENRRARARTDSRNINEFGAGLPTPPQARPKVSRASRRPSSSKTGSVLRTATTEARNTNTDRRPSKLPSKPARKKKSRRPPTLEEMLRRPNSPWPGLLDFFCECWTSLERQRDESQKAEKRKKRSSDTRPRASP